MKLRLLLLTVFAAGIGASFALADDGHKGNKDSQGENGAKCHEVHVRGTIAPQTLTVTLEKASKGLNLAAGSQVVLQVGTTGQTVRVNAEACSTTSGSTTQLAAKSAELRARSPKPVVTTATTTNGATTTNP